MIVFKHQLLPGTRRRVRVPEHLRQPVLRVPGVRPAPVCGQVSVGVVSEAFAGRRHEHFA